ncbi:gamma-glutamylcyclotransferase family protein [uncultured Sphaerochaeta sp.]|uniref:gamma-glutamylcyclotransferase family protein n=1 Tax=uncultured Sphaerochaeta sp. TaxID=886478 RepID=UPI002A0A652E|nr:gamma-glutamylcyclotransferase family protein [uncultured Sphaerochaeta sp.]
MLRQLLLLKDELIENRFDSSCKRLFEGAGLVISPKDIPGGSGNYLLVITPYAQALSALVNRLKDICSDHLDYLSKYSFYGRLGEAANKSSANHMDEKSILLDVNDEAIRYAGEVETIEYFAYGSNMDTSQMTERCHSAKSIGVGRLVGYQFSLDAKGVATVQKNQDESVWGVGWNINGDDIVALDGYEGVRAYCYRHAFVQIEFENMVHDVLIYISNRAENQGVMRQGYVEKIYDAAVQWQFPPVYQNMIGEFTNKKLMS